MEKYEITIILISLNILLISFLFIKIIRMQGRIVKILYELVFDSQKNKIIDLFTDGGNGNDNKNARPED
ncbi:hypothetical protein [Pseudobutyrivibrio sp.]|uniref:hypothetical protein n=1 Tax=Pseudobutyrivibrio sp. TaxID=2014367 RepID=UPI0038671AEF